MRNPVHSYLQAAHRAALHAAPRAAATHAARARGELLETPALPRGEDELDEGAPHGGIGGLAGEDAALQVVNTTPQQQAAPLVHQIPVRRVHQVPAGVAAEETGLVEEEAGGVEGRRAAAQAVHAREDYVSLRRNLYNERLRACTAARSRSRRSSSHARDIRRCSTPRTPRGCHPQTRFPIAVLQRPVRSPVGGMRLPRRALAARRREAGDGRALARRFAWRSPWCPSGSSSRIRTRRTRGGLVVGVRGVWGLWV